MPPAHRHQHDWTPQRFERWAADIGPHTARLVSHWLNRRRHVEQSYRSCLGLLSLAKRYTPARLEAACQRAIDHGIHHLNGITAMLDKGLDQQPLSEPPADRLATLEHPNIRGNRYYH